MTIGKGTRVVTLASGAMVAIMCDGFAVSAQKVTPAEIAAKLSGTWTINMELSPGFSAPGAPGGRRGGRPSFALAGLAGQRGGGRGGIGGGDGPNGPADLTPEERAAQTAMRQLQQIAQMVTIKATPESVTFIDPRGEQTFAINDKNAAIEVAGASITVKNKWDKQTLKQEFSSANNKLTRTWDVDQNNRLVLKAKLESMSMVSKEVKAVFDKQQ